MTDYPINLHILAEDMAECMRQGKFRKADSEWLYTSLCTMCVAYDELVEENERVLSAAVRGNDDFGASRHSEWNLREEGATLMSTGTTHHLEDLLAELDAAHVEVRHRVRSAIVQEVKDLMGGDIIYFVGEQYETSTTGFDFNVLWTPFIANDGRVGYRVEKIDNADVASDVMFIFLNPSSGGDEGAPDVFIYGGKSSGIQECVPWHFYTPDFESGYKYSQESREFPLRHQGKPYTVGFHKEAIRIAEFATADEAAEFISKLPDHEDGRYYLDGPERN